MTGQANPAGSVRKKTKLLTLAVRNRQLYIMILPVIIYLFIFNYMPMYGVQVAFRDYKVTLGIETSEWVGLTFFQKFFNTYYAQRLILNTLTLNVLSLVCGFPMPIILAVLLNQIRTDRLKRTIQTIIYIPHFISTIVLAGMLYLFLAPSNGILNTFLKMFGVPATDFMADADSFRGVYILSGIWQGAGFSSILYVATLSSVDPALYEAAEIDGASIWKKIRYIDMPTLIPIAMMTLILNCGSLFGSNTTKVLALQTSGNISTSDIIGTYVYNNGVAGGQFSYTSAIGLLVNFVNLIMILSVNTISKKAANIGMF